MLAQLGVADWTALAIFLIAWLLSEPFLISARREKGMINADMILIRRAWMRNTVARANRVVDAQLVGQVLNSNSFFASSNLILIAAAIGAIFHGEKSFNAATTLVVIKASSPALFEVQIGLIVLTLARGLLAFTWSIRQLNYCLAALGAAPRRGHPRSTEAYADAVACLLNPALSSFNTGVLGYYFAVAAAAWLFGPWAFMGATVVAVALPFWRQKLSPAASAICSIRGILEGAAVDPAGTSEP